MTENQQPTKRYLRPSSWVIGCALLPVILFVGLIGVRAVVGPWPRPPLWQVERVAKVDFPKSARLLNSYGRWFMEVHIYAKIEMDAADVEPFLKSLPQTERGVALYETRAPITHVSWEWWDPGKAKRYKIVQYGKAQGDATEINWFLIDLDNPRKAVVYMCYSWFR